MKKKKCFITVCLVCAYELFPQTVVMKGGPPLDPPCSICGIYGSMLGWVKCFKVMSGSNL